MSQYWRNEQWFRPSVLGTHCGIMNSRCEWRIGRDSMHSMCRMPHFTGVERQRNSSRIRRRTIAAHTSKRGGKVYHLDNSFPLRTPSIMPLMWHEGETGNPHLLLKSETITTLPRLGIHIAEIGLQIVQITISYKILAEELTIVLWSKLIS